MEYNTMDVNEYITYLSDITKVEKKKVYVIVIKNFMAVSAGKIELGQAYCNISSELTNQVQFIRKNADDSLVSKCAII